MLMRRIFLMGLLGLFFLCQGVASAEMVSVVGEDINMRSGPGTQHGVLWKIGSGFPVEVIKSSGDWLQVKDFEGSVGWLHRKVTAKTPHMIVKANKGTEQTINVRKEPSTKSAIVAKANYGVVFKTLGKENGWVKVEHGQGVNGWVEGSLLWGF